MDISIANGICNTKIYDKRDDFNFDIVAYPDIRGNIPDSPAYGVIIGQVIRIARSTTYHSDFVNRVKLLITKLINKEYLGSRITNVLKKCLVRHSWISLKYKMAHKDMLAVLCA